VDFVYNIDFFLSEARGKIDLFAQIPNIIDAPVAGGVYFYQIDKRPIRNRQTILALSARTIFGVGAINRFGQNTSNAGLANAPWTGKQIGMRQSVGTQSILESLDNVGLSNDFLKGLGAVFSI
jgi:hypothetical protein